MQNIFKKLDIIKALRFSKIVVILMLASVFAFTVGMILIFIFKDSVPDTLITEFFGFFKIEGGITGIIKIAETIIETIMNIFNKKKGKANNDKLETETELTQTLGGDNSGSGDDPGIII